MITDNGARLTDEQRTNLKRYALLQKDPKNYNSVYRLSFRAFEENNFTLATDLITALTNQANSIHPHYLNVVNSLIRSRQRKAKNLKEKIQFQLEQGTAYFITLTFSDDTLKNTNESTRRKYVTRLLKSISSHYVANIDYGKKKGREHYHAVSNAPITPDLWLYGLTWCQEIGKTDSTAVSIGKYITKLTNHALKDTTNGRSRFRTVIYSRNV